MGLKIFWYSNIPKTRFSSFLLHLDKGKTYGNLMKYRISARKLFFFLKVVRIRSYSDPHFSAFGLNKERYGVTHRIQSERGKIRTRITPNGDTFYAVKIYLNFRPSLVRFSEPFRTIIKPFWPMLPFYIPWKHKKTLSFPVFSGDTKLELWLEAG